MPRYTQQVDVKARLLHLYNVIVTSILLKIGFINIKLTLVNNSLTIKNFLVVYVFISVLALLRQNPIIAKILLLIIISSLYERHN